MQKYHVKFLVLYHFVQLLELFMLICDILIHVLQYHISGILL